MACNVFCMPFMFGYSTADEACRDFAVIAGVLREEFVFGTAEADPKEVSRVPPVVSLSMPDPAGKELVF